MVLVALRIRMLARNDATKVVMMPEFEMIWCSGCRRVGEKLKTNFGVRDNQRVSAGPEGERRSAPGWCAGRFPTKVLLSGEEGPTVGKKAGAVTSSVSRQTQHPDDPAVPVSTRKTAMARGHC